MSSWSKLRREQRGLQSEVERLRDAVATREASIAELNFAMEVTKQQHGAYQAPALTQSWRNLRNRWQNTA